jgi:hypothetical protein
VKEERLESASELELEPSSRERTADPFRFDSPFSSRSKSLSEPLSSSPSFKPSSLVIGLLRALLDLSSIKRPGANIELEALLLDPIDHCFGRTGLVLGVVRPAEAPGGFDA